MFSSISAAGGAKSTQSTKNTKQNCSKFVHSHKIVKKDYTHRSPTRCCQFLCLLYQVIFFSKFVEHSEKILVLFSDDTKPAFWRDFISFLSTRRRKSSTLNSACVYICVFICHNGIFPDFQYIFDGFLDAPLSHIPPWEFYFFEDSTKYPSPKAMAKSYCLFPRNAHFAAYSFELSNLRVLAARREFLVAGSEDPLHRRHQRIAPYGLRWEPGVFSGTAEPPPPLQAIHILCGTGSAQ